MLSERFSPDELNEARMRMARIPAGAELVANAISKAPGFNIGNVYVMAGVPAIMQAMLDVIGPTLRTGAKVLSDTVQTGLREGDIGGPLAEIANAHPAVSIGSYPFWSETGPDTNIVVRSRDAGKLLAAMAAVKAMVAAEKQKRL